MSMVFESNGQEIWSPSLRVGNLFLKQVEALEQLLDMKSGMESFLADTVEIDAALFNSFVIKALETLETTNNPPLFALLEGCIKIAIALNEKITGQVPDVSEKLYSLVVKAKTVMSKIDI